MRESEIEIVRYPQLKGLSIFFDTVSYRTPHVHRELELLWILEGQMEIGGIRPPREASRGELFLFNPGQIHEFDGKGQKCTFLCFQISKELLSALPLIDRVRFDEAALSAPPEGAGDDLTAEQWHKHIQKVKEYLARAALEYLEMSPGYELGCSGQMQLAFRELLAIASACGCKPVVWAAWGAIIEKRSWLMKCVRDLNDLAEQVQADWVCAGNCSVKGHPHHPLYLKKDEPFHEFDIRRYLA